MDKEELKQFLKDNLEIRIEIYKDGFPDNEYINFTISLLLENEIISESTDNI